MRALAPKYELGVQIAETAGLDGVVGRLEHHREARLTHRWVRR